MQDFSNHAAAIILLAGGLVLSSIALLATTPETHAEIGIDFWEAYARGLVSVTMEDRTYQRGEDTVTLPVGIRVGNAADEPVVLSEEAVLMSPFPAEPPWTDPEVTTQDAVLTPRTIPAGGSLTYFFGDEVDRGYLPEPVWWCSEEFQFTRAGVSLRVGGETLPFALRPVLADRHWESPESNTQADFWLHLRTHPAAVVGKDPLWTLVPARAGERVQVRLRATNLAIYTFDDGIAADVNVTDGVLEDRVPAGWTIEAGSFSVAPDEVVSDADGSQILRWFVDLPAALEGEAEDPRMPTEYVTVHRSYVLETPSLTPGRYVLPRARSDMDGDGTADAHSAPALVEAFSTDAPPVPSAGGPYAGSEGETILLDASASEDPEGADLQFRWDLMDNGTFTDWSSEPVVLARYVDDFTGYARVEVTDGTHTVSARAAVEIGNAAPEILEARATAVASFRLVVAGERWHDVLLAVSSGDDVLAEARVQREPGSPAEQSASTGRLDVDLAADLAATIRYTPADDPMNGNGAGDNPAWLVIAFPDGSEVRLSHNFNVRRESTWTWDVRDLGPVFLSKGLTFSARLRDAGADDLTATWDFDDGTTAAQEFPNDGSAPFEVVATAVHAYDVPRVYRVRLVVSDDDGGSAETTLTIRFP